MNISIQQFPIQLLTQTIENMQKASSLKPKQKILKQKPNQFKNFEQKLFDQIHTLELQQSTKIKNNSIANTNNSFLNWKYQPNNNIYMNRAAVFTSEGSRNQKGLGFARLYTRGNIRNSQKRQNQHDSKQETDEFEMVNNVQDPLAKLINKAKQITNQNQGKIQRMKKEIKKKKQETFLTGTGLYEQQIYQEQPLNYQADENLMLKQLIQTEQQDDLAELRRMIKMTDKRLKNYSNQVYYSSQNVINAADHFKKHIDTSLLHKINRIEVYEPENTGITDRNKKKYYSINKNRTLKYG